jgi:hypothetical protein
MSDTVILAIASIIVAIIGAIATIASSYIGKENQKDSPKEKLYKPAGYTSPTRSRWKWSWRTTIVTVCISIVGAALAFIMSAHASGNIAFSSMFRMHVLNSSLQWEAGSSEMSSYTIDGNTISLTAGPHTWPNFPMVHYKQPVNGDFRVQVKALFTPEALALKTAQMVGILVRPMNARMAQNDTGFPENWAVASKYVTDAGVLVGCRGSWIEDASEIVFLKVERVDGVWKCAYSHNGENWTYLNANVNDQQSQDRPLVISLFAYTDTNNPITVEFSDWEIVYDK